MYIYLTPLLVASLPRGPTQSPRAETPRPFVPACVCVCVRVEPSCPRNLPTRCGCPLPALARRPGQGGHVRRHEPCLPPRPPAPCHMPGGGEGAAGSADAGFGERGCTGPGQSPGLLLRGNFLPLVFFGDLFDAGLRRGATSRCPAPPRPGPAGAALCARGSCHLETGRRLRRGSLSIPCPLHHETPGESR